MLRLIEKHISFAFVRERLKDSYSDTGRPSIDPELLLRILRVTTSDANFSTNRTIHLRLLRRDLLTTGEAGGLPARSRSMMMHRSSSAISNTITMEPSRGDVPRIVWDSPTPMSAGDGPRLLPTLTQ